MSPFATLETDMIRHEKFERIPPKMRPAAFAIHVAFILHSAEQLTDGRVLRGNATEICRFLGLSRPRKTLVSMEEVGLLSSDKRAFYVHDYADFQPTRSEVEERRKRDAQRKRDARLGRNVQQDILEDVRTDVRGPHTHAPELKTSSNSSTSPKDLAPAAVLDDLGWSGRQMKAALRSEEDLARALAWAKVAPDRADTNPGGWAWSGFDAGGWPSEKKADRNGVPSMINVVDACQRFIEGQSWDATFDEQAMREEFGRIERGRRTEGTIGNAMQGLLEQWAATRQDRYDIKANLGGRSQT